MKILMVFPKQEVVDLLLAPLEAKLGVQVTAVTNVDDVATVLSTDSVQLAILDASDEITSKLAQSFKEKKLPSIFCMNDTASFKAPVGFTVSGTAKYDSLLDDLVKIITPLKADTATEVGANFAPIRTSLLVKMGTLDMDIFIRLSATHFVKIVNKGDVFDAEDFKKYTEKKKVSHMYLPPEGTKVLADKCNSKLKELLGKEKLEVKEAQETVEDVVETVRELIDQLGVTEEVQELVKNSIDVTMKAMGDFPELGKILKDMTANPATYISGHSMMLSHVACSIAVAVDWYSEATFEKLTMAAFMHDTPLKKQELCAVTSLEDFEKKFKGKFSLAEREEYKAHPERAAKLVAQFKEMPAEVDKIILQHHEHPYGTGFPGALSSNYISPLSTLFIIAHDLVDFVYANNGQIDIDKFLVENEKKYGAGNFKKIAKALAGMEI